MGLTRIVQAQANLANVLCFPLGASSWPSRKGFSSNGAVFVLGAASAVFEHQKEAIDWVTDSLPLIEEILPFSLLLMLTLVVFALYRAAGSVLERLNGISLAAHNALHTNYGKGTHTNSVITSS